MAVDYAAQLDNRITQLEKERSNYESYVGNQDKIAKDYYNTYLDKSRELDKLSPEDPSYNKVNRECIDALNGYYNYSSMANDSRSMIAANSKEIGNLKREKELYERKKATGEEYAVNEDYEADPPILIERPVDYSLSPITKQLDKLYELDLYVYIAGVYIPTAGVSISNSFGGTPTASISVPPDPTFLGIGREDRIPVQIFIKDTFSGVTESKKAKIPMLYNSLKSQKKYDDYIKSKSIKNNKILLFSGIITSYSYSTTANNRTISLMCETDVSVLTDIKLRHSADVKDLMMEFADGVSEDTKKNLVDKRYLPISAFYKGMSLYTVDGKQVEITPAPTPPNTTDMDSSPSEDPWQEDIVFRVPGDFMDNMVAFISTGDTNPNSDLIAFYEEYAKKMRLKSRYLKIPFFDNIGGIEGASDSGTFPVLAAMQKDATAKYIGSIAQNISLDTPYDFLNSLASMMEYEISVLATPICRVTPDGLPRLGQMLLKPMLYEAIPPACNIIQKEHLLEVNFNERVHGVPTRVIAQSLTGVAGDLGMSDSAEMMAALTLCYPEDYSKAIKSANGDTAKESSIYTGGLLSTKEVNEKYTGPYVHRFSLPAWLDYMDLSNDDKQEYAKSTTKILWAKHMWVMARSEYKTASITMTFNPYITVGAPAIVIDADTYANFSLIGYVVSVEHSISKGAATTTVGLNFPRMLDEEMANDGASRLTNTVPEITKVTQASNEMNILYSYIYGCNAYDYMQNENPFRDNNKNPRKAYINNWRDICTLEEYYDFLSTDPEKPNDYKDWRTSWTLKHKETTYLKIDIPYLTERRDPELINKLSALRDKLLNSDVYRQSI